MFALKRYLDATGDIYFLADEGVEMLVETARMWEDLGFYAMNAEKVFHIHGVTGPDEYTTVVNDNMYTNVMARFNLRYAARTVDLLGEWDREAYDRLVRRVGLKEDETTRWSEAAQAMYIPYDEKFGIHPQDDVFLDREPWDFEHTPPERYPLLLHYHPLVIYRHQVLKQADVVLAMVLRGEHFSLEQKRRNFDYYDPITTGDSSLSACVQAVAAAQIGYDEMAFNYFCEALYVDLADTHGNTSDGVHIASAGGVWGALIYGFAGMYDNGMALRFAPSLPPGWDGFSFRLQRHNTRINVDVDEDGCLVTVLDGPPLPLADGDDAIHVEAGSSHRVESRAYAAVPGESDPDDMDDA
jgi:alpha,alpha-trehalose phosphorylase